MLSRIVPVAGAVLALSVVQPLLPGQGAPAAVREEAYRANNIGVAYLEQFNHEAGAKSFSRALEIDPGLTLAKINLAIALYYVPDLPAAQKVASEVAASASDAPQPHYILGLIAKTENRVDDALAAFGRVLELDATDLGARVNLAQLRMQRREYDAAVELLRPAVAAEPYHVTALYNLGVALVRAGRTEEGQKTMAEFQKLREGGYGTTFSNNYLEQGRYAEAIASTGAEADLVDAAAPPVRFAAAETLPRPGAPARAPAPEAKQAAEAHGGGLTLADLDRDGDLDLVDAGPEGTLRVFLNDKGTFTDATAALGIPALAPAGAPLAALAADYDNDERVDLFVLGAGAHLLLRQTAAGRFEDATKAAGIPAPEGLYRSAAFVDADHDGDLDLFLAATMAPARNVLLRNNGNGTFADVTAASGVASSEGRALAVVPTDYDNRRDVDFLVARDGAAPLLLKNLRDGTFRDAAADAGLGPAGPFVSAAAGDYDKDGYTDFFLGRRGAAGRLFAINGRLGFHGVDLPDLPDAAAVQFIDHDNDGLLDLVAATGGGLVVKRHLGRNGSPTGRWSDAVPLHAPDAAAGAVTSFASGDVDGDGDTDIVARRRGGDVTVLRNEGGSRLGSLAVRLEGRVSNRSAVGAKIEMRAGSLRQKLETVAAWPAPAPADVLFGLGRRASADVVRVLWPAGILQAEIPGEAQPGASAPALSHRRLSLTELDRKPSSCPYLYTWNGERFEFITDFMGGGEMGYVHAPGVVNTPDPEEYTRIDGARLRPRDGRYELRVTNELEEALFVDRLQLVAVDHPAGVEVHPREGLFAPPFPAFEIYAAAGARPVPAAFDSRGRDVTDRAAALDRRFVDDLPLERIRGYARPHTLTLDLGPWQGSLLLLLTGWTDYAFSSDNIAAHQAGLSLTPPALEVQEASGAWRTIVDQVGIPVGRPQTVVVDLTGRLPAGARRVRITTSMRIYWDWIRVASAGAAADVRLTRLDAVAADLRWRGFSAEASPDGREPYVYDYDRVTSQSPWKLMPGRYTREGDVRELLRDADDFFVVSRPGDEIALGFDAAALPPPAAGWTRTFLLHSVGYSKEMDRNSASPDQASPLPFRRMTRYPYAAPEHYPDTPAHRAYRERWNTRVIGRQMPPIELAAGSPPAAPAPSAAPTAPSDGRSRR